VTVKALTVYRWNIMGDIAKRDTGEGDQERCDAVIVAMKRY